MKDKHTDDLFARPAPMPPIVDEPPRARAVDPPTSHAAEASIADKVGAMQMKALEALFANIDGLTVSELIDVTGIEHQSISPRLRPLAHAGYVEDSGLKRKGKSGRLQIVWRLLRMPVA